MNSSIRIENKLVIFLKWVNKGIMKIKDLLGQDGNLLPFKKFKEINNFSIPFTEYEGIVSAIPRRWKTWLRETGGSKFENTYTYYENFLSVVKPCYLKLNKHPNLLSQICAKWDSILPNLSTAKMSKAIKIIYTITILFLPVQTIVQINHNKCTA